MERMSGVMAVCMRHLFGDVLEVLNMGGDIFAQSVPLLSPKYTFLKTIRCREYKLVEVQNTVSPR